MKVSKDRIDHLLSKCTLHYNRLHGTTTICQVVLPNGFMVATGMSGCIDPANFDEKLGREYAKSMHSKKQRISFGRWKATV